MLLFMMCYTNGKNGMALGVSVNAFVGPHTTAIVPLLQRQGWTIERSPEDHLLSVSMRKKTWT